MSAMSGKRITIMDVAREAGVDKSTVSLALRGDPRITPQAREHVHAVAKRLNYLPNQLARALSGGRTKVIGVLLTDMDNRFFLAALEELHAVAEAHGYALSTKFVEWDEDREARGLAQFCEQRIDGLIWAACDRQSARFREGTVRLHQLGIPFVMFGRGRPDDRSYHQVAASGAIRLAMEYLAKLGHRRIGSVTACAMPGMRGIQHTRRLELVRAAAKDCGLVLLDRDIFDTRDNAYGGVQIAAALTCRPRKDWPNAIFANDDMLGRALIIGLSILGIRVPEDISILGMDDAPGDEEGPVPLTTVSLETREVGRQAGNLLLGLVEQRVPMRPFQTIELKPRIVERASVAPARS